MKVKKKKKKKKTTKNQQTKTKNNQSNKQTNKQTNKKKQTNQPNRGRLPHCQRRSSREGDTNKQTTYLLMPGCSSQSRSRGTDAQVSPLRSRRPRHCRVPEGHHAGEVRGPLSLDDNM